jgi:hypothetical protein
VLVRELAPARKLFVDVLGGRPFHEEARTPRGTHSLYLALGEGSVIELARPLEAGSPEAVELERSGEMLYSVTFRVADLARAAAHLESCGLRIARARRELEIEPGQAFGALYRFTDLDLPGDPRSSS